MLSRLILKTNLRAALFAAIPQPNLVGRWQAYANGNEIRGGQIVKFQDKLCLVIEAQHHRTGRGHAFMKVELRDVLTGSKYYERFRSDQDVEVIQMQARPYQFLYKSEGGYTFMHKETFEQIEIPEENAGPKAVYLEDGVEVNINFHEDTPISIRLPEQAVCVIKQAETYIKGQSAVSGYKPAILENGRRITVPPFISSGDRVVVKVETEAYVGRAATESQ